MVFVLASGGALASSACSLGCIDPDPDCHGNYDRDTCDCNGRYSGSSGSYSPTYPSTAQCYRDGDCPERQTCTHDGRCEANPTACASDDECPLGARCFEKSCRCHEDAACGNGLTCTADETCEVCIAGSGAYGGAHICRALTCDEDGRCPAPLTCNRTTLECVLGPRVPCADAGACAARMTCGADGFCERAGDAGVVGAADAGTHDAQLDAHASD